MATKKVNLNFFQLVPQTPEDEPVQVQAIKGIFSSMPATIADVRRGDFMVSLYGGSIEKRDGLFLGTLIHTQMNNIPPSYDRTKEEIKRLPLADGVGLAYQTNFLYDPEVRIAMIESVQNGVSIGGLCALINRNFDVPMLDAAMVINPTELAKLQKMSVIKKFDVKIAKLEDGTIFKEGKKSFSQITESADNTNTQKLEYTLTASRMKGGSLNLTKIRNMAMDLVKYKTTEEVEKLIVVGQENEESPSFPVDLIKERVKDFITIETERLVGSFNATDRKTKIYDVYKKHRAALKVYKLKKATP